jgi:hypothetical protein
LRELRFPSHILAASFPDNRHHDGSLAGANIALDEEYLLPSPQNEFALGQRDSQGRPQQGCLKVGMAVAVMPSLLVTVFSAGWNEPVEHLGKITLEPGLELDGSDGRRAADAKNMGNARAHASAMHDFGHVAGDVQDMAVAFGLEMELLLKCHGIFLQGLSTFIIFPGTGM